MIRVAMIGCGDISRIIDDLYAEVMPMAKAYYASSIRDFLDSTPITVHGHILIQDEMRATTEQKNAWRDEIAILQKQLRALPGDGSIIFEYTVPRIGSRIVQIQVRGMVFRGRDVVE